jgi:GTP cyclohydrolase II
VGKQGTISTSHLAAGRAVDQLRRQLGIVLQDNNGETIGACPIEGLTQELLTTLQALPKKHLQLLLTGARARHSGIKTSERVISIDVDGWTLPAMQSLADPLAPATHVPKTTLAPTNPAHATLMVLVKHASLLPAMLLIAGENYPKDWLHVSASDVETYWQETPLDIMPLVEAKLPIEGTENTSIVCFRERYGTSMHLALAVGDISQAKNPLVRVHSSCITGDILGSMRCDCGSQLQLAMQQIVAEGSGILVYLHQEGRGIGIANKLRAYALQEQGVDTYDANLMLGFDEDERDFTLAAAILKRLGVNQCRLLTNNPHKLENLKKHGINVSDRVGLAVTPGLHNHDYLAAKAKKSGHLF